MTEELEEWEYVVLWFLRLGVAVIGADEEAAGDARRQLEQLGVEIDSMDAWWSEYPMLWLAKFARAMAAGEFRKAAKAQEQLKRLGLTVRLFPQTLRRSLEGLGLDVRLVPGKQ